MSTGCLFCNIVARTIPAKLVLENDHVLAFEDIRPVAPKHALVIPKKHIAGIHDATPEDVSAARPGAARRRATWPRSSGSREGGYRLVINQGPDAGQSVFHVHCHVLGGRPMAGLRADRASGHGHARSEGSRWRRAGPSRRSTGAGRGRSRRARGRRVTSRRWTRIHARSTRPKRSRAPTRSAVRSGPTARRGAGRTAQAAAAGERRVEAGEELVGGIEPAVAAPGAPRGEPVAERRRRRRDRQRRA